LQYVFVTTAEELVESLVNRFLKIADQLKDWKNVTIDPSAPLPALQQVCDAKNTWLAAKQRPVEILMEADVPTRGRLRQLHPEVEMDTSVRYLGRGQMP
jgi:hypothetical protein